MIAQIPIILGFIKKNIKLLVGIFLTTSMGAVIANEVTDNALLTFLTDLIGLISLFVTPSDVGGITIGNLIIATGYFFLKIIWASWFIVTHIHYIFFMIELFIIAKCIPIKNPIKMIERYVRLHISLIMFFFNLTIVFINMLIRIGTMIANLIPGT